MQENCNQIVDKYIEYDITTVFIDILLLKISAYRHFIFNTEDKVSTAHFRQHCFNSAQDFCLFFRTASNEYWCFRYFSIAM